VLQNLVEVEANEPVEADAPEEKGVGWRERLRRLDERYPRLSRWMGGRLDIEVPALAVSLGVHLSLILALGVVGYKVQKEVERRFEATTFSDAAVDTSLDKVQFQDLDQTADKPALTAAAGSFSPNLSTVNISAPPGASPTVVADASAAGPAALAKLDVRRATESVVPTATMFGQNVSIKGNGAEHVENSEGAVDRVAEEILRRLEKGRTLVVWAFDSSRSLQAERERLAKHIDTVYAHINQGDGQSLAADGGLLTAVVAFGQGRKAVVDPPTADYNTVSDAIRSITELDTTGIESTFQTVAQAVDRWGNYKDKKGNRYRTMIIVVTDEVGDDENYLEPAIEAAVRAKVPVYVLGSQAIFARKEGRMNYTDPKTGHTFYNLPVTQGPESLMLEQIRLPFWYDGNQYDILDSGFGPYALSRLAGATGGIYFVTRLGQTRMGFDPVAMREYKPDWFSRAKYESEVLSRPVRKAVIDAALITQQNNLPGMPSLVFPPVDGPEFKEAMEQNQALAERTTYTVNEALGPITAVAKLRDRETSRRWQAHYDLIRGRLLAAKVRTTEYNWACAKMKKDAPKFTKPDSNAWRLVPDAEIHYSDKAAAAGKQAVDLLKKVVAEHPNTPWALLAQRELKDPLGFKWVEVHVKPIVRNNDGGEAAAKKKAMTPKPPEPPKL